MAPALTMMAGKRRFATEVRLNRPGVVIVEFQSPERTVSAMIAAVVSCQAITTGTLSHSISFPSIGRITPAKPKIKNQQHKIPNVRLLFGKYEAPICPGLRRLIAI